MKKYIKSDYWPVDVRTVEDIIDVLEERVFDGITDEDWEDYLIELESFGNIDRDEFKYLKKYGQDMIHRFKSDTKAVTSATNDDREFEYISYLSGLGDTDSIQRKQKQYIYKCVSESPQVPDLDTDGEEAWSEYARDVSEYKIWCFVDAVDLGIFTESEESLFNELWDKAETDMAQPYA